ncbi:hypothetical protein ROSINTL182_05751 [Roseburia intestinalis L1-82]|uniref:Uncharacterized protein n=1 Tax=Roseburia intestinalis L1-82 TaxID=536231 RepID=C7G784_9FIRM|nr:hypothetical protein ROSINTL182_05751 [Roseburia intestinalis L1-82]
MITTSVNNIPFFYVVFNNFFIFLCFSQQQRFSLSIPLFSKEKRIYMFYYKTFSARMLHLSFFIQTKFILLA